MALLRNQHQMMPPQQHQQPYQMANFQQEQFTPLQPPLTKSQIRFTTWGQLAARDIIVEHAKHKFYSIPDFRGASKAAFRLMRTEQFQNANKIYVDSQPNSRLLEQIVAFSGKDLFVPASRESGMACQLFRAVQAHHLPEILKSLEDTSTDTLPENTPARDAVETAFDIVSTYYTDQSAHEMEELDMVIVGCVAVSASLGQMVGRGYGHTDLTLAMLQHMGGLGPRTIVVTVVHADQLLHNSHHYQQRSIFRPHDYPVDLIVMPNCCHVVHNRAPRPDRLYWDRISRRRLVCTPLLGLLHRDEVARLGSIRNAQHLMALKDDDSDVESSRIQRNPNLAKYHKNRGTVDLLSGDELQAYNLVIFGRFADGGGPEALATGAAVEAEGLSTPTPTQSVPAPMPQSMQQQQPQHVHNMPNQQHQDVHQALQLQQQQHHQLQQQQQQHPSFNAARRQLPPLPLPVKAVKTTPGCAERSKDQYRWLIWQRLQTYAPTADEPAMVPKENYKIPVIANVDAAAHRLAKTTEFCGAEHVFIFNHTNTEAIGLSAVHHGKQLYVPSAASYVSAFTRVQPPPGLHTNGVLGPTYYSDNGVRQMPMRKPAFLNVDDYGNGVPMPLDPVVQLDLVVISAVCAARNGRIIGTGYGHADLLFGILLEAGAIAHWTKVVCIVDDVQLFDELPEHIFHGHDMPVDMIVTPTQCIHVQRAPKRPVGLTWCLLSKERIHATAVLCALYAKRNDPDRNRDRTIMRPNSADSSSHYRDTEPVGAVPHVQQPPLGSVLAAAATSVPPNTTTAAEPYEKQTSMSSLPSQFIEVPEYRTTKLKQFDNCVLFQFYEMPPHMTRHILSKTIQIQMGRKAHHIKYSKRKCRAYVYFKDVGSNDIHELYARCSNLVIYSEIGEVCRFSVLCNDPVVYQQPAAAADGTNNQQPSSAVWLNNTSYGMPWSVARVGAGGPAAGNAVYVNQTRPPYGEHNMPLQPIQMYPDDNSQTLMAPPPMFGHMAQQSMAQPNRQQSIGQSRPHGMLPPMGPPRVLPMAHSRAQPMVPQHMQQPRLSHQAKPYVPRAQTSAVPAAVPVEAQSTRDGNVAAQLQQQQQQQHQPQDMVIGVWNPMQMP